MNIHRLIIALTAMSIVVVLSVAFVGRWSEDQLDWGAGYSALLLLGFVVLSRGTLIEYAGLFCVVCLMLLFRDRDLDVAALLPSKAIEMGPWVSAGLATLAFAFRDAVVITPAIK